jgi:hypothetical protein
VILSVSSRDGDAGPIHCPNPPTPLVHVLALIAATRVLVIVPPPEVSASLACEELTAIAVVVVECPGATVEVLGPQKLSDIPRINPNPLPPPTFSCFSELSGREWWAWSMLSSLDFSSGETADAGDEAPETGEDVADELVVPVVLADPRPEGGDNRSLFSGVTAAVASGGTGLTLPPARVDLIVLFRSSRLVLEGGAGGKERSSISRSSTDGCRRGGGGGEAGADIIIDIDDSLVYVKTVLFSFVSSALLSDVGRCPGATEAHGLSVAGIGGSNLDARLCFLCSPTSPPLLDSV